MLFFLLFFLFFLSLLHLPPPSHVLSAGKCIAKTNISEYMNLIITYPCRLRVLKYPFGRYVCNLTLVPFGHYENMEWKVNNIFDEDKGVHVLDYIGSHDLMDYRLDGITVEDRSPSVTLTLHLIGQPDYHLTNSFLPSSLMFIICYSSFFFPIAGFNERIMVSLTSLLVLVALFSQATGTYIRTPYYKLIDVWYVALIMLCFAVVIANGIVNYLRVQRVKSHSGLMKKVMLAKKFNIGSQMFLMFIFLLLIFIFVLFSNDSM